MYNELAEGRNDSKMRRLSLVIACGQMLGVAAVICFALRRARWTLARSEWPVEADATLQYSTVSRGPNQHDAQVILYLCIGVHDRQRTSCEKDLDVSKFMN